MTKRIGVAAEQLTDFPEDKALGNMVNHILEQTKDISPDKRLEEAFRLSEEYAGDHGPEEIKALKMAIAKELTSHRTSRHRERASLANAQLNAIDKRRRQVDRLIEGTYRQTFNRDKLARARREAKSIPADYKEAANK